MSMQSVTNGVLAAALAAATCAPALGAGGAGAKLVEVRTVDEEHVMVHWLDGEVLYKDDGEGPTAFMGHETQGGDIIKHYEPNLDLKAATTGESYTLTSADDAAYSPARAAHPVAAFRKTKVNGTDNKWPEANFTLEHTIFLKLPQKLQQGKHYTLAFAPGTNSDTPSREFTFDAYTNISEAIHTNIIGYNPDHPIKAADLYMWLGDGGARDYSAFTGRKVILYNTQTQQKHDAGEVAFWKKQGTDVGGWNFTRSDVWNCDFSSFNQPGKYRLVIEGIGCSPDFQISRDVYYEPYKTSVRGFFYMRIGMGREFTPIPRQPSLIPGKDPANLKVYLTTFSPQHPDWHKVGGDTWDKTDWSKYNEPGNPTNPNAWGGHSDACDWDRHGGHISIIWDMLLPYFLSNGKLNDDNLNIAESGNGIPDIIDEARYEVDFWLRLRDTKGGYSWGVNNPPKDHSTLYQAAAGPYMAWASAANAAMLADCFRIAGNTELMNHYRDAAIEAWKVANEGDLDYKFGIGNGSTRGRDLKMMAAAFLYNVTGDRFYEDAMAKESVVKGPTSQLDDKDKYCQYWGTAAYLMCARNKWQEIHYPELLANMQATVLNEAKQKNAIPSTQRPSRRSSNEAYGWFQTTQEVQLLTIAHAVATEAADKDAFLKAMILESDWGLGRNPLNMVQMTGLGSRHADDIYTTGRNDGVPGVHPGHTPYMNADPWGTNPQGAFMHNPQWYAAKGYPAWKDWPHGEALWRARYCYSNNEFTPQQTMRGKMAVLGYLYALGEPKK